MNIFKKVFDFFCGDWRIFWGIAITICLVEVAVKLAVPTLISVLIFLTGISFSLGMALRREIKK